MVADERGNFDPNGAWLNSAGNMNLKFEVRGSRLVIHNNLMAQDQFPTHTAQAPYQLGHGEPHTRSIGYSRLDRVPDNRLGASCESGCREAKEALCDQSPTSLVLELWQIPFGEG